MTSTTLFSRVRDAGEISSELKSFGSFRSVNRFDPNRKMSKHDDIFANTDVDEQVKVIEPEGEHRRSSANGERRAKGSGEKNRDRGDRGERKHRHERGDKAERGKQRHDSKDGGRESKERRERRESSRDRPDGRDRPESKDRRERTARDKDREHSKPKNGEDNDEEFMNYLSQRQNRRRKKRVNNHVYLCLS